MSADNGVYILATRKSVISVDLEYRVAHAQNIDAIYFDEFTDVRPNPVMIRSIFGAAPVFSTVDLAVDKAMEIYDEVGYTEYGIGVIYAFEEQTFNQLIKE